jgi:hypothetical protein
MDVILEAIKFNHDPTGKTTGAFDLRRNETETMPIPEWCVSRANDPDSSAAAYAISDLPETVTIKGLLRCSDTSITEIYVKAIDGTKSGLPVELQPRNVLGEVECRPVPLKGGQSDYEYFNLRDHKIFETGTASNINTWRWQYSLDRENWYDITNTEHRIYTVPSLPQGPWEPRGADPSSVQIPWTEVLDYTCQWAAGLRDLNAAAAAITKRVNALGKTLVTYRDGSSYARKTFNCSGFLRLLRGGVGPQTLDCDDCATIVSTFANILGCGLYQSGMDRLFDTNRILPIGESSWRNFVFFHHSVAWEGECLASNILFDACFQIDTDGKPKQPPQNPIQPAKIHFGNFRDGAYAFCFSRNGDCKPNPTNPSYGRKRRSIGKGMPGKTEIDDPELLDFLSRIYDSESWPNDENIATIEASDKVTLVCSLQLRFQNWILVTVEDSQNKQGTKIWRAILTQADDLARLLEVQLFECTADKIAKKCLLELLGTFHERLTRIKNQVGTVAFVSNDEAAVLFKRGRFVSAVLSAGKRKFVALDPAAIVDQFLKT